MTSTPRDQRLREVVHARIGWIRLAAEHTHHRHNVSALLRTADALGVHRVHLIGERPLRAVSTVARGSDRWLDLHHHPDAESAVAALRAAGVSIWVADLDPDAVAVEDLPLDRPVCLWMGAELVGVGPTARAAADGVVGLPMRGMAQSLNVTAAATALLHVLTTRALAAHGPAARLAPDDARALLDAWSRRAGADDARAHADLSDLPVLPPHA